MAQCRNSTGLEVAIAGAAVAREAEFATRHRARLDTIKARIAAQPPLD
jgi:hypothetical protein